jgi:hypothetical protein
LEQLNIIEKENGGKRKEVVSEGLRGDRNVGR